MACLIDKRVVFSGTFDSYTRRTAEQRAMDAGCLVTKAVSKKTDILVCGEEPGSKLSKAENLGRSLQLYMHKTIIFSHMYLYQMCR